MKRTIILVFLALLLLPLCAAAVEEKAIYDYLSDDIRQLLCAEYNGWEVSEGTSIYVHEGWNAWLLFLSKDEKNIAIIMEDHGSGFEIVAINDAIIPDKADFEGYWWVSADHMDYSQPFIWFTPENKAQGFYYELRHEDSRGWIIESAIFGDFDGNGSRLAFARANNNTALRVHDKSYFSPVYVPNDVDLTFSGFDPDGMKTFCMEVMTLKNEPMLIPSTMEANALPQGQTVAFEKGQKYPVYSGPGKYYMQAGEQYNAVVSTDDWIQVFGQEDGWLFIQYNIADGQNRFGYISAPLPRGIDVPELKFEQKAGVLYSWITDDPLRTVREVIFPIGAECVQLATMGDSWTYIEIIDPSQPKYRGFTPAGGVKPLE